MLAHVTTACITGLKPTTVTVEVDLNRGKPQLIIIGLASQAVTESKERITSALLNCDIKPKSQRTIVNLAPADIKKTGTSFDLAITVGILKTYKKIYFETKNTLFLGELSLDGSIKKIKGVLPLLLHAKEQGIKNIILPKANQFEIIHLEKLSIFPIGHLSELLSIKKITQLTQWKEEKIENEKIATYPILFEDIFGQIQAKRGLEIAAAGGHNILLTGPPGTGKSMLATASISILPPLNQNELLDINSIYSVAGLLNNSILTQRPFRAPHHTITSASLFGGGSNLQPGEISLAHTGILFLDEITELPKYLLESLRQPLEDKKITLARISGSTTYPCEFILIAANNPCSCGYRFSQIKHCNCTESQYQQYNKKLSGPILDRIDLQVFVNSVDTKKITEYNQLQTQTSKQMRDTVIKARKLQKQRYLEEGILTNSQLTTKLIRKYCQLTPQANQLLQKASLKYFLSTRAYFRVIKVAKTICDLENDPPSEIGEKQILEALQFRKNKM